MLLKLFTSNKVTRIKTIFLLLYTLAHSVNVYAHYPTLSCKMVQSDKSLLNCIAGFSDGSLASKAVLKVFSYDEELHSTVISASDGSAHVKKPAGEYYIVFNPDHETPAEFDYAELE